MQGGNGHGEGPIHLPGGKRFHVVERAQKVDARGVVDGIFHIHGRWQVYVTGADEIYAMHVTYTNSHRQAVSDFFSMPRLAAPPLAFEVLVRTRRCRLANIAPGLAARCKRSRRDGQFTSGIWVLREDLMIVVVGIIQEEVGGGESVIGGKWLTCKSGGCGCRTSRTLLELPSGRSFRTSTPGPRAGAKLLGLKGILPESGHNGLVSSPFFAKGRKS